MTIQKVKVHSVKTKIWDVVKFLPQTVVRYMSWSVVIEWLSFGCKHWLSRYVSSQQMVVTYKSNSHSNIHVCKRKRKKTAKTNLHHKNAATFPYYNIHYG